MDIDRTESDEKKLEEFVVQMMSEKETELGGEDFENRKKELLEKLAKEIEDATIDALPDDRAIALNKLLDEKGEDVSEEEVKGFFDGLDDRIKELVEKAMSDFSERYFNGEI